MSKELRFKQEISDFFYFVIWDSISQILIESAGNVEQKKIKTLQKELCTLFMNSIIDNYSHSQFKSKFTSLVKSSGFINELMGEYIIETLSLFRLRLFNIISQDQIRDSKLSTKIRLELQNSIEQYVILSYLDKFVLSNVVKILLYSSRISFAEVNEFRIRLIEIFRDILEGSSSLKDLTDHLISELNRLSLEKTIREFISASIIGYFNTITRFNNYIEILNQMKKSIINKITVISDTSFIDKQRIDNILLWVIGEVVTPFFDLLRSSNVKINPSVNSIVEEINFIFRKQLERKYSLEMVRERMENLEQAIEVSQTEQTVNRFKIMSKPYISNKFKVIQKKTKNKISFKSVKTSELEKKFENDTELTPERIIEMEFEILLYLAAFLDNELSLDYQLDNFYTIIKQNRHGTNQIYL